VQIKRVWRIARYRGGGNPRRGSEKKKTKKREERRNKPPRRYIAEEETSGKGGKPLPFAQSALQLFAANISLREIEEGFGGKQGKEGSGKSPLDSSSPGELNFIKKSLSCARNFLLQA